MFDTPFCEFFSKTPWFVIPIVWIPIGCYFMFIENTLEWFPSILLYFYGIFCWTFVEYFLHRFLFHAEDLYLPHKNWAYVFHFTFHGIHHSFPQDRYRLVFPPLPGLVAMSLIKPCFEIIYPELWIPAMATGIITGYILYDVIHYVLHHTTPKDWYFRNLKMYHMQHHYRNGEAGFGVSNKFWDIVFRTELQM